uniref:Diacylglycerol kinase family lipid kinase n=1 Tax=Cohnella candidum TaxID=2674991 RepID=A0A3G3K4U0_9BACL|nr:diacylglycerol kinase family lipid kinase [Cohnella candidum]
MDPPEEAYPHVILFVVNEKSGNGRGKKAWQAAESILRERGTPYAAITATSPADAILQAKSKIEREPVQALVAVGGDGTVHSLLPLAVEYRLPLGLIPSGSGNDTALAFGIPKDPAAALDIVLGGSTRPSDLLAARQPDGSLHYSLISVAIGLDGAVAEDVNGSRYKRWCNRLGIGSAAYIIGLFRMLAAFKPQPLTVTVDGRTHVFQKGWLTAVANLATYGGGLKICPDAKPSDGLLHVCVVHGCSALQLLSVFPTVLSGKHVGSKFVTMLKGTDVSVEAPVPLLAYGDGEPAGHTPVRASVLPRQLLIFASASG